MLSLGFFNPMLLWLVPLAAIPIIIHLLNRRRFQKVPWAAMEYLLRALKQNRRRIQMEHWLLLLLRTLAVLLLVFLVTRPQLTGGGLVDRRTHHIVVVDDSASMAQRAGVADVYKQALDKLDAVARSLGETNTGDLFTLIRASKRDKPDLVAVNVGQQLPQRIREAVPDRSASAMTFDLEGALDEARKRARDAKEASRTEYYIITDFRRDDWLDKEGKARNALSRLSELDETLEHVQVIEIGGPDVENLGITAVKRVDRLAVAGTTVTLAVEVKNFGRNPSPATELALEIDGTSSRTRSIPPLGPGESRTIDLRQTFHLPGFHGVTVSLPADRYPVDDKRSLALEVKPTADVLIVDGDPVADPSKSETELLSIALDPSEVEGSISGITPTVIPAPSLATADLSEYEMVWLCNMAPPDAKIVKKLEAYVAAGGGLVFCLGGQVEASDYNPKLYKAGDGLLPLALTDPQGDFDKPDKVFVADATHPAVNEAVEFHRFVFGNIVNIRKYFATAEDATAEVKVILRIKDANGPPLLVSKVFQNGGTVTMFTTTADGEWDSWSSAANSPMLTQAIHRYGVKIHDLSNYNQQPDGQFNLTINRGQYNSDVLVKGPNFERTYTSKDKAEKTTGEVEAELTVKMRDLVGCGLFDIVLRPTTGDEETRLLARNPPTGDSQLDKLTLGDFKRIYPDLEGKVLVIPARAGSDSMMMAGQGEIWRLLAIVLLFSLVLETLLAWRFGRR